MLTFLKIEKLTHNIIIYFFSKKQKKNFRKKQNSRLFRFINNIYIFLQKQKKVFFVKSFLKTINNSSTYQ